MSISVLYDGWPLIYQLVTPSALHLLAILERLPPGIDAYVAIPGEPPGWLPDRVTPAVRLTEESPNGRLRWEQRTLARLAREMSLDLIHTTSPNPPLFSSGKTMVSPTGYGVPVRRGGGFSSRLREALAQGGMTRASGLIWPEDLPQPEGGMPINRLPPIVYGYDVDREDSSSDTVHDLDLPESYILCHGPSHQAVLRRAMGAWSWAAEAIGEYYPLVILVGMSEADGVVELAESYGFEDSVRVLSPTSPSAVNAIYRRCAALFHPAPVSPWGGAVRRAMVHGAPIVAEESPMADAMLGAGAFLVDGEDTRAMGAALITVVVEEEVAEHLSQAARERVRKWAGARYGGKLLDIYQAAVPFS